MKASEFMKSRGKPAPSLPVTLHLVSTAGSESQDAEGAPAVFRFVPDRIKTDADADASRALAAIAAKGTPVTDEIRAAYEHAHLLHAILRDADKPGEPFFDGADECRAMLMPSERLRLLGDYQAWIDVNFPSITDPAKFKEAMADAESFTVKALLTKYGYAITRNCVISSALTLGTTPTMP